MAITTKEGILKVLTAYNPWWKTGAVNLKLSKPYKRFAFYEAMKRLNQTDIRYSCPHRYKARRQNDNTIPNDRGTLS